MGNLTVTTIITTIGKPITITSTRFMATSADPSRSPWHSQLRTRSSRPIVQACFFNEAYPENVYARHALAHLKLRMASHRPNFDTATQQLVDEAVAELELQHARTNPTIDDY